MTDRLRGDISVLREALNILRKLSAPEVFSAAALAFAGSTQAGVVYNWQTVNDMGAETALVGRVEVTNDAWRSGSINYDYRAECSWEDAVGYPGCNPIDYDDPTSPVVSFLFRNSDEDSSRSVSFDLRYRDSATDYIWAGTYFHMTVGETLGGALDTGTITGGVAIDSVASLWTVSQFYSDKAYPCGYDENYNGNGCHGVTGRWVLDQSTAPGVPKSEGVPAPATLTLLGLGVAVMVGRKPLRY